MPAAASTTIAMLLHQMHFIHLRRELWAGVERANAVALAMRGLCQDMTAPSNRPLKIHPRTYVRARDRWPLALKRVAARNVA
jgi:hypothetical protein